MAFLLISIAVVIELDFARYFSAAIELFYLKKPAMATTPPGT